MAAATVEPCAKCEADGYCPDCNPLGGSYAAIKEQSAAEEAAGLRPAYKPTRREVQWGRRRGSGGWSNRRRG